MKKIGFIGCGNMGEAMLSGIMRKARIKWEDVFVCVKSEESENLLSEKYNINICSNPGELAKICDLIFIAVKPFMYREICENIACNLSEEKLVIGMAPGYGNDDLKKITGGKCQVCAIMPNVASRFNAGFTAVCLGENVNEQNKKTLIEILDDLGTYMVVEEKMIKAVSTLSGSGIAFVFMMIEAFMEEGISLGMKQKEALMIAAETLKGAAHLCLELKVHPAMFRDSVCSPGGTTICGVKTLEKKALRGTIIEALENTAQRFEQISKN